MVIHVASRVALAVALAGAACSEPEPEWCAGGIDPLGDIYQYVASRLTVPTGEPQVDELGLNLDSDEAELPDNGFGRFLVGLSGELGGLDLQAGIDVAVSRGQEIALIQLQTSSLQTTAGIGTWIVPGSDPSVAPCASPSDPVCGHHLDGSTAFQVAIDDAVRQIMTGQIVVGEVRAGPGMVVIQLPLFADVPPLLLTLVGARLSGQVVVDHMSGVFGGAITAADLHDQLLPGLLEQLNGVIALDCTDPPGPETPCGCTSERARQVVAAFDTQPSCTISAAELLASPVGPLLEPDVDLFREDEAFDPRHADGMRDALSVGLGFDAVGAQFPPLIAPYCSDIADGDQPWWGTL